MNSGLVEAFKKNVSKCLLIMEVAFHHGLAYPRLRGKLHSSSANCSCAVAVQISARSVLYYKPLTGCPTKSLCCCGIVAPGTQER